MSIFEQALIVNRRNDAVQDETDGNPKKLLSPIAAATFIILRLKNENDASQRKHAYQQGIDPIPEAGCMLKASYWARWRLLIFSTVGHPGAFSWYRLSICLVD